MIIIVIDDEAQFQRDVLEASTKVLVDFWAEWCGPCKAMNPILHGVSEENDDVQIVKLNVDTFPELAIRFNVRSIPTLILFHEGKEIKRHIGMINREELLYELLE